MPLMEELSQLVKKCSMPCRVNKESKEMIDVCMTYARFDVGLIYYVEYA